MGTLNEHSVIAFIAAYVSHPHQYMLSVIHISLKRV